MRAALSGDHETLLTAFLAEETARGRRVQGIETLKGRVPWFLRFLEEQGKQVTETTRADAYAYQGLLIEKQTRAGTPFTMAAVSGYVKAAATFCAWLARSGRALDNPFLNVRRVRIEKRIPTGILTERDMAALLDELRRWDRDAHLKQVIRRYFVHVVAELQYASGLRIAEVAALMPEDIDLERALVYVRDGKQGSNRIGFLTDYAVGVLDLYLNTARPLLIHAHKNATALFFQTRQWLQSRVNVELSRACAEAGVPKITSHGFRHALGYHLLRAGCKLRYIQAILGHKHLKDTEVYTKIDVESVKAVLDTCHPRMHG